MHIITFLAFSTGLAISYVAAAPALIPNTFYPNGVVVKYYPNGLPAGLYPGTELTSRATNLAKRDPQTTIDAPGVAAGDLPQVEVTACSDENFSGRCLVIRSFPGQCVGTPPPAANDITTSVGPNRPWKCRFYVAFTCQAGEGYIDLEYPGTRNLGSFNDKISSYRCTA